MRLVNRNSRWVMAPFCLTIHLDVLMSNSQDSKTIWKSLFSLFVQAMLSSGQGRSLYRRFEKKLFPDIYQGPFKFSIIFHDWSWISHIMHMNKAARILFSCVFAHNSYHLPFNFGNSALSFLGLHIVFGELNSAACSSFTGHFFIIYLWQCKNHQHL